MPLRQLPRDERAERVGDRQRQALPGSDHQGILGVQWVDRRHVVEAQEPVLVKERRRLEAPVHLEGIGAGADLAAAEIEDAPSRLARSEARRVGKGCGSTCRYWGSPYQ